MNAAIIGCGYVGKPVAQLWQDQGLTITATTTRSERVSELQPVANQVVILRGTDEARLRDTLNGQTCVLVSVAGGRQNGYAETYLKTAETLAMVLSQVGTVAQLIYTSSFSVYGDHSGNWVTETTPVKPAAPNAEVLAETERVLLTIARPGLNVCILRLGGIYGPRRELARIYGRWAGTTRPGAGAEWSNWIHLDDIVGAIDFARMHGLSGVYNLVQDEIPTVRELVERVCSVSSLPAVTWDPSQPSDRPYNVRVSNQKLKAAGYRFNRPQFNLE
ncbi:SDR family oxidoreductase [Pseudanabaena sp. FACHB-2040]|uniref:SDR family oxidoreductase n=1 Tax=Pseudanabaena sp. FACHB-2040 TaxID=2692859 RepID=UPI00168587A1|nr:SDR family oxidoreductase [Pseudanabaena sp. FACHB-2040]MBD2258671.1 SDR family oxidoreductase [Pseudanabaena sp. FACHB-2040]